MSVRNVTVTSKNQITLPTEYVKSLQLARSRVLQAEIREGKIVLTPQPSLNAIMKPYWSKHHAKRFLTDAEIKQAVRSTVAQKAAGAK